MSRSGYTANYDCDEPYALALWRGAVASATYGKRGQAFLREMLAALDAIPDKRLIANELVQQAPDFIPPEHARTPQVCAIGSVGLKRGVDMEKLDVHDYDGIAAAFGIAQALVREIEFINDEWGHCKTPEERWQVVRDWVAKQIKT